MIDTRIIGNALGWFEQNLNPPATSKEWRLARNEWLRLHGIGGIIKNEKKSKTLPNWWGSETLFWFTEEKNEEEFVKKFGK